MVLFYSPLPIWWKKATKSEEFEQQKVAEKSSIPLDDTVQEQSASRELSAIFWQVQQNYQRERRTFL